MSGLIITVQHLHSVPDFSGRVGFCARGGREWAALHGLDWATLVRDGVAAEVLEATGDAMALRLVAHARAQAATKAGGHHG